MKFDTSLSCPLPGEAPRLAQVIELLGFDSLWTSETSVGPFLPLSLASEHTRHISLGTAIALGFARSPSR